MSFAVVLCVSCGCWARTAVMKQLFPCPTNRKGSEVLKGSWARLTEQLGSAELFIGIDLVQHCHMQANGIQRVCLVAP